MLDIFSPYQYLLPIPAPDEILLIKHYEIEKYTSQRRTCCELTMICEGYARVMRFKNSTEHNLYVLEKSIDLTKSLKEFSPDEMIFCISYLLVGDIEVGVYIREATREVVGCIKGRRANTHQEYDVLWGTSLRDHQK
jgi:hypothetical protein